MGSHIGSTALTESEIDLIEAALNEKIDTLEFKFGLDPMNKSPAYKYENLLNKITAARQPKKSSKVTVSHNSTK